MFTFFTTYYLCGGGGGGGGAVAFRSGGGGGRQVVATDVGVVVGGNPGGGWMPQTNRQKIRVRRPKCIPRAPKKITLRSGGVLVGQHRTQHLNTSKP